MDGYGVYGHGLKVQWATALFSLPLEDNALNDMKLDCLLSKGTFLFVMWWPFIPCTLISYSLLLFFLAREHKPFSDTSLYSSTGLDTVISINTINDKFS